jgi:bacteriorhodopsin
VVVGQLLSPRAWILLVPLSLFAATALARVSIRSRRARLASVACGVFVVVGLATSLKIPGPSFPFPWRSIDWLLFLPILVAGLAFAGVVLRLGDLSAWVVATATAMIATFIAVYVVTPYPFAWHLGTSSSRVVIGPAMFLAALAPLVLERSATRSPGSGR